MKAFEITKEDIERLNQFEFTQLMQKLLRAELSILKLKQSETAVSLDILDPDGGLDGYIGTVVPDDHVWLPAGKSGWQFKAVKKFGKSNCKTHFLTKDKIKPKVKKLLDRGETYVLAIGKKDFHPLEFEEIIKEELSSKGYHDSKIKVYSSGQIAEWVNTIPSVTAFLKQERTHFKDIKEWLNSSRVLKDPPQYIPDETRKAIRKTIQNKIASNFNGQLATIIRLVGLPGIGKTRLIYETLNIPELKELVLYLETPEKLPPSHFNEVAQNNSTSAIFVIDECSHDKYTILAKEVEGLGGRITLVTLDFDIDRTRDSIDDHFILKKLEDDAVEKLVQVTVPSLPVQVRRKIVEFCQGYPRTAVLLSQNFSYHPELLTPENLNKLGIVDLFEKMIAGRQTDPSEIRRIDTVLTAIAIFRRLGWDEDLAIQGRNICNLFKIDWTESRQIVQKQEERGLIIKKGRYRYVTPLPLAVYLSSRWWETVNKTDLSIFIENLDNAELRNAFFQRLSDIPFAHNAKYIIEKLFSEYDYQRLNTQNGSRIFYQLTNTDHNLALDTLERIFDQKSIEDLLLFKEGRRYVVWSLEKIVWWPDTFLRAIKIILRLAEAENETISNNATGLFSQLFQIWLGGTAVPFWERLDVLEDILNSNNKNRKKIALKGLDSALNLMHGYRITGAYDQGIILPPEEWQPQTHDQFSQSVTSTFKILSKAMNDPDSEIREESAKIFFKYSRLLLHHHFFSEVIENLKFIQKNFPTFEQELLGVVEDIAYYDREKLPNEVINQIIEFRESIFGEDFKGQIKRYVQNRLIQDYSEENKIRGERIIEGLAEKCIKNPTLLKEELYWLTTPKAENGFLFGNILGKLDSNFELFDIIFDSLRNSSQLSLYFFSGYLIVLKEKDERRWEDIIYCFYSDNILKPHTLEILWRSGGNDFAVDIILKMLKEGDIPPESIDILLYGAWFREVPTDKFHEFLSEFYHINKGHSISPILGAVCQYVEKHPDFLLKSKQIILKYLKLPEVINDQMALFYWSKLSKKMISINDQTSITILKILINFLKKNTPVHFDREIRETLSDILKKNPKKSWNVISMALLGSNLIAQNLIDVIKGDSNFDKNLKNSLIELIPEQDLWEWVDQNPQKAPYILATMIPIRECERALHPIAKKLLMKFPSNKKIMSSLSSNWHTGEMIGPFSSWYEKQLQIAEKWAEDKETSVQEFARMEIKSLKNQIEREKQDEEEEQLYFTRT